MRSLVAGGNSLDVTTLNDTKLINNQYNQSGAIAADLNASVRQVSGDVNLSAQAFCNSASISTDPNNVSVDSSQECHAADPSTDVNAAVQDVAGNVSVSGSSIGNSFEEDTNAPNASVQNNQLNDFQSRGDGERQRLERERKRQRLGRGDRQLRANHPLRKLIRAGISRGAQGDAAEGGRKPSLFFASQRGAQGVLISRGRSPPARQSGRSRQPAQNC